MADYASHKSVTTRQARSGMREGGTFGQRLCASAKPQFRRHKTNTVLSDTLRLYDDPVIAWLLTFAPKFQRLPYSMLSQWRLLKARHIGFEGAKRACAQAAARHRLLPRPKRQANRDAHRLIPPFRLMKSRNGSSKS